MLLVSNFLIQFTKSITVKVHLALFFQKIFKFYLFFYRLFWLSFFLRPSNVFNKVSFIITNFLENGYKNDTNGGSNPDTDTVIIMGKEANCYNAKLALLELIPIVREIEIPCDLHYSIIGQKGKTIRNLMDKYNVFIDVPSSESKSNTIKV